MSREGPHQFYLRARQDFIKSPGLDEAANLYFAVENLDAHEIHYHPPPSVREAFLLLKNEGAIGDDDVDMRYGAGLGSREADLLRLDENNRRREKHNLKAEKVGTRYRRLDTPGNYPVLEPAFNAHSDTGRLGELARNAGFDLRKLWQYVVEDATFGGALPEEMIDAIYSYRPTGDHPMASIFDRGLNGKRKWHSLFESLYSEDSPDHASVLDRKMRRHDRDFGKMVDSGGFSKDRSHEEMFGVFDDNSMGLNDLFTAGLDRWRVAHKMAYPKEGDVAGYIEYLKLKAEGVPSDSINSALFDEEGNLRPDHSSRSERAIDTHADPSQQMGLLPLLLGLENASTKDGKAAIKWFIDGAQGRIVDKPDQWKSTSQFDESRNPSAMLSRVFRKRLGAITAALTTPLVQAGIQQPPTPGKDIDKTSSRDEDLWEKALSYCRADKTGTHRRSREDNPPVFHQMMNSFGILPDKNGVYGLEHPTINEELIDGWLENGVKGITKEQVETLKEWRQKVERYSRKDWTKTVWAAPYDGPYQENGRASPAKPYHDIFADAGGHSMSPSDILHAFHQMYGGLFTMSPHYEEHQLQGKDKKKVRKVRFDEDSMEWRGGSDDWERVSRIIGEGGLVPYLGEGEMGEDAEKMTMDYNPWFGPLMTKERDLLSAMEGTGSPLYRNNSMHNFAALPGLVRSLIPFIRQQKEDGKGHKGKFGDGMQLSSEDTRRGNAENTGYNLGSTYPHQVDFDLGNGNEVAHLIDLALGLFHNHGQPHSLFDLLGSDPTNFLAELMERRHDPITSDISSPLLADTAGMSSIGRLLEGANLIRYLKDDDSGLSRIADSPYDNIGSRHAIYHYDEEGLYPKSMMEDGGEEVLSGFEPDNGRCLDNVAQRLQEFRVNPESFDVEKLLIHPHRRVLSGQIGDVRDLRDFLSSMDSMPVSQNPEAHRARFKARFDRLAAREGWDAEEKKRQYDIMMGDIPPDDPHAIAESGKWRGTGHMEKYDILPVLDPNKDEVLGLDHRSGPLGGSTDIGTKRGDRFSAFSRNFNDYLITSGDMRQNTELARQIQSLQTIPVGDQKMVMSLGSMLDEKPRERHEDSVGYIIGPEPFRRVSDWIERLRDFAMEFPEDSIARMKVNDAIKRQQAIRHDIAYSEAGGLDESDSQINRMGFAHLFYRMLHDTVQQTGAVAQALKAHCIAQDQNNAALFNDDAEGYANHMEILHFAESLLHSEDQSWRKALGKEMEKLGNESLKKRILEPHSQSSYISPKVEAGVYNIATGRYEAAGPDSHIHERLTGAFAGAERVSGLDLAQHYIENNYMNIHDPETLEGALRALAHLRGHTEDIPLDENNIPIKAHDHFMSDESLKRTFGESTRYRTGGDGSIDGIGFIAKNKNRKDLASLMQVLDMMRTDSHMTRNVRSIEDGRILGNWRKSAYNASTGLTSDAQKTRNYNTTAALSRLLHRYELKSDGSGQMALAERGLPKTVPFGGKEGLAPLSLLSSAGVKRRAGTDTSASLSCSYDGGLPKMVAQPGTPGLPRRRAHVASNVLNSLMGTNMQYGVEQLYPAGSTHDWWDASPGEPRTAASRDMVSADPNEHMGDSNAFGKGWDMELDVLTNEDLLYKKDEGDPVPIKPMHRIFQLEDLEHLRGFSDDWVVSSWPEGERVIVYKKKKKLVITNGGGKKVTMPNKVRKDIRAAYKDDFIIDGIWDDECLHIVDVIQVADEKVWDERTKDRNRLLRAKFEATEHVSIPAPINTKRTDSEGLQRAYDDLMKEKGVKQVLLRDAEATYMKGESRHPKWVLWRPDKTIDVLVVCSSGAQHCLGVGPIDEEMAKRIGNRSQEYEGEHYMDVGSLYSDKVEEGDYITVAVSSTSVTTRKKTDIYQVNAPRYVGPSESHATDSIDTLRILSPATEHNMPHTVRVKKGNVLLSFPLGDVVYETESIGHGFIIKSVDAPSDYLGRIAESQRDYWAPLAAVLLRSDIEKMKQKDEKAAVVPEPPANHDKKPKKVLKPSERLLKDPELAKSIVVSLHKVEELLKEKITWTGPKGLGIDHGSPVESPSGPTENTEGYNLPDHDPGHRQEKHGTCWCGAEKGQTCEQGRAHKMEDCPIAHPPRDESKDPKHIQFSHSSHEDSSV